MEFWRSRSIFKFILIFFIFFLLGCSQKAQELTPPEQIQRETTNNFENELLDKSQSFKDGFRDGCASAKGTLFQDEGRFLSDEEYNEGWYRGKKRCQGE